MKPHLQRIWTGPETNPKPIIYLGGNPFKFTKTDPDILKTLRFCCLSYYELGKPNTYSQILPVLKKEGIRAFLDSGAFSYQMAARKRNQVLDRKAAEVILNDYADWVLSCNFVFDFLVTFDYERNPAIVRWSTDRLEARGLHPIPVYHIGASLTVLRDLIDRGYSLIGIGGMAGSTSSKGGHPSSTSRTNPFLDQVFNLTEKHSVRLHGFGVGGQTIIRYPWFCMTENHSILTKRGWLTQAEVRKGDLVLARQDNGSSLWEPVKKIHRFNVSEAPVRNYHGRFSASVSLNHNWRVFTGKIWRWRETQGLCSHDQVPRSALYHLDFPTIKKYSDDLVRIIAWVWTDGSICLGPHMLSVGCKTPRVNIYQCQKKHPLYTERIRNLLQRTGSTWRESIAPTLTGGETICFDISRETKLKIIDILGFPKILTFDFILSLTSSQLHLFINEVLKGDGGYIPKKKGSPTFDLPQKNGPSIQAFKLACVLAGIPFFSYKGKHDKQDYGESVLSSNIHFLTPRSCRYEDILYTGILWCVEVPSHTFFTRCEGSYYWTGNSVDSTSWSYYARHGLVNRPSLDPQKLFEAIPVSSKISSLHDLEGDDYNARMAENIRFWSTRGDLPRRPRKRGLF